MQEFNFFGYKFSSYLSMLVIGSIFIVLSALIRADKYKLTKLKALIIALFVIIYGCIGVKLLYVLESPGHSFSWRGGMSLFGSIILIPVAFLPTIYALRIKYTKCMDFVAAFGPLIFAFMRIGCFLNDCCGGIEITIFGTSFIPNVQLLECFLDICILVLLLIYEKKGNYSGKGRQYPLFIVSYGTIRFFIEFWRDSPKNLLFLSRGQWLSVLCILIGLLFLNLINKKQKKKGLDL